MNNFIYIKIKINKKIKAKNAQNLKLEPKWSNNQSANQHLVTKDLLSLDTFSQEPRISKPGDFELHFKHPIEYEFKNSLIERCKGNLNLLICSPL